MLCYNPALNKLLARNGPNLRARGEGHSLPINFEEWHFNYYISHTIGQNLNAVTMDILQDILVELEVYCTRGQ